MPPVLLNPHRLAVPGGGGSDIFTLIASHTPRSFWKIDEAAPNYADSGAIGLAASQSGTGNAPTHNQPSIYGGPSAGLGKAMSWPGGAGTSKIRSAASGQTFGAAGVGHTAMVVVKNVGGAGTYFCYGSISGEHLIGIVNGVPQYSHARTTGTFYTAVSSVNIADGGLHVLFGRTNAVSNVREIWVDGILRGSITGAGTPKTAYGNNLTYGYETGYSTMNGLMGCQAVFNKLLTGPEMLALAASIGL